MPGCDAESWIEEVDECLEPVVFDHVEWQAAENNDQSEQKVEGLLKGVCGFQLLRRLKEPSHIALEISSTFPPRSLAAYFNTHEDIIKQ